MRKLSIVLLVASGLAFLLSAPCLLLGLLGLLGLAADISSTENHQLGVGFLKVGLIPFGIGTLLLFAATVPKRRITRRRNVDSARPNRVA